MAVIKQIWQNFERWISMFFIAFLAIALFVEVLSRYVFYTSVGWISEITGFMFVWFIYLSISYVTGQNSHIRVQILDFLLPERWIQRVDLCMNLVWLAFNVLMTFYGIQLVLSVVRFPFKSTILDISMAVPYAIIPIAFGLMTIRLSINMIHDFRNQFQVRTEKVGEGDS
jgi:TRAP-type C4-dicarboxylate transport system permease small subunit